MRERGRAGASRQDELLEGVEFAVELSHQRFQAHDMGFVDGGISRHADFAAEVEQVVLDGCQRGADGVGKVFGKQNAEG